MLQNKTEHSFPVRGLLLLIIVSCIALYVGGCEDPGPIGGSIGGSETNLVIDTVSVNGIGTRDYNTYSGSYQYFSAGAYDDPVFGSIKAVGMLKPALPSSADTIKAGAGIKLKLAVHASQIYGDSLADQQFKLYKINELWRGRAWKVKDKISYDSTETVASFTVGTEEDTLRVPLNNNWVNEYRQFVSNENADSLYGTQFLGLAMVPVNSNKIIPISIDETQLLIENPQEDSFSVGMNQWAYNLERDTTNSTIPGGSVPLYSTYEQVINFSTSFDNVDVPGLDIAKAELVLYQNKEAMDAPLPDSQSYKRPTASLARLQLVNPDQTPEIIDPGSSRPFGVGEYVKEDSAYHFNITPNFQNILLNGGVKNKEFYITFSNNGVIRSNLIYTDSPPVPSTKTPKIIVTSLKNRSN